MEEGFVVSNLSKCLFNNRWKIIPPKKHFFYGEGIIPDIVALKEGDLLCAGCKGTVSLHMLMENLGQAITNINYGANVLIIGVPFDLGEIAVSLVKDILIRRKGKIGVFAVEKDGSVKEIFKYKRFDNDEAQKQEILSKKVMYVADLKIDEIGRLLDFAYKKRSFYETSDEFTKIVGENWQEIFPERNFLSEKNIIKMKMIRNFFITMEHLGIWDHRRQLNEQGEKLRLLYTDNKKEFSDKICYIFLTQGNWLNILKVISNLSKKIFNSKEEYYLEFTKEIIEKKLYRESGKIESLAKKMNDRFFRFLREWNLIIGDTKNKRFFVNWERLLEIFTKFNK